MRPERQTMTPNVEFALTVWSGAVCLVILIELFSGGK